MNDLSVLAISNYFGFERSYLYRIFKNYSGMGIKEYIIKTRMEHAQILLRKGYSVGSASLAVGYNDQTNFSKAYKKYFGESPKKVQICSASENTHFSSSKSTIKFCS